MDRTFTTSDHYAITFDIQIKGSLVPLRLNSTQRYNTRKTKWSEFCLHFESALLRKTITSKTIENIINGAELETILQTYSDSINDACIDTIPGVDIRKGKVVRWWPENLKVLKEELQGQNAV
ncbi:hypothetical protein EVAR_50333_1 [Eumeta japonica]|uniref:Endonuclease/exonuclease/phosphatase domain-containing protein n=1 Tax=Eumeta variegata TaxID=151549 RepID=A0A4C1XRI1_EUMVA|nr:hypothetical protein EVAR_50333_1 [Eumeta japonica]